MTNTLTSSPVLCPVHLQELPLLAEVARSTFTQTFSGVMSDESFNAYMESKLSDAVLAHQLAQADNTFFLVRLGDEKTAAPVGFVRLVFPSQKFFDHMPHETWPKQGCLLDRFYFLNSTHGSGVAPICMQQVFDYTKTTLKADALHLSTWEKNIRAQRFYAKMGFDLWGYAPFDVGHGLINTDYVYLKRLHD
jgi:diamine N-acetyltransferase